jgi:hypothetical protein
VSADVEEQLYVKMHEAGITCITISKRLALADFHDKVPLNNSVLSSLIFSVFADLLSPPITIFSLFFFHSLLLSCLFCLLSSILFCLLYG